MPRIYHFDSQNERNEFLHKALLFADSYTYFCLLNGNNYCNNSQGVFPFKLAIGAKNIIEYKGEANSFESFKQELKNNKAERFGILSYDLKNVLEKRLSSKNKAVFQTPLAAFFEAEIIIEFSGNEIRVQTRGNRSSSIFDKIQSLETSEGKAYTGEIDSVIDKPQYLEKIKALQEHIKRGDIYEINFCMEFLAKYISLDPIQSYLALNKSSATPFSGLFKWNGIYVLSASPERFLKKEGLKLYAQPIKGTRKRESNPIEDKRLLNELANDPKEQAENVMIVDLVRNDLTPFAKSGSIKVEELFGLYSFPQVHQMISTISAELKSEEQAIDALFNAFPMGSMTGAPKLKAMELIEAFEESKRAWYSGAMGYISAQGNFDFNVIIRSIIYSENEKTLSFQAGSAITYDAKAELEYEECLLKAKALREALYCK